MNDSDVIETIKRISGVNPRKCMRCGKCSGACPAYDAMDFHPHQFVDMIENGRIDELLDSEGINYCFTCMACVERCPRSVQPAAVVEAVRCAVLRRQGNTCLKAEDVIETLDEEMPQQLLMAAFRKYKK